VQVADGFAVVRADQRHPGFQGRLESVDHEGQRQEVNDGIEALLEQCHQRRSGRSIHQDRLNLGNIRDSRQLAPIL
jgi:hypothetical protein